MNLNTRLTKLEAKLPKVCLAPLILFERESDTPEEASEQAEQIKQAEAQGRKVILFTVHRAEATT